MIFERRHGTRPLFNKHFYIYSQKISPYECEQSEQNIKRRQDDLALYLFPFCDIDIDANVNTFVCKNRTRTHAHAHQQGEREN